MSVLSSQLGPSSAAQTDLPDRPRSVWRDAWDRMRHNRTALVCGAILGLYIVVAAIGFSGVLDQAKEKIFGESYHAPGWRDPGTGSISAGWWFGTDFLGRSVFWRMFYGARVALTVAFLAGFLEVVIGLSLGAVAGYFGGWIDAAIVWLFSTVSSIPWILMMISLAYALQGRTVFGHSLSGIPTIVLAMGLTDWVGLCRLIRGEVLKHRERDYVVAARAMGLSHARVIFRHLVPNVFHIVIITFCLSLAGYVQAEVVLSFLGLGVTDVPSWGRMIDDAKLELLRGVWWQMTAATVAIFVFSLAVNIFGDALRDALDPRLRGVE